jgi:hypothetical protein
MAGKEIGQSQEVFLVSAAAMQQDQPGGIVVEIDGETHLVVKHVGTQR